MDKDLTYAIRLRDCFTGGYTLPQYCIDNGIRKPLFVSEKKFLSFVWQICIQFRYDKRLAAKYSFINLPSGKADFSVKATVNPLTYKNISEVKPGNFDAIILLTTQSLALPGNVISFAKLTRQFILK